MPLPSRGLTTGSYLLFRSTALDREYGRLDIAPAGDAAGPRAVTPLTCDRVDFAAGRGLCLSRPKVGGVFNSVSAIVFNAHFATLHTIGLAGLPSRARVAPDGRYGAVTTFVTGDSYATMGTFSTRTDIIDLTTGKVLFDLEKLRVTNGGKPFRATDFNFWGVTFTNDSAHFYATLATGGSTYLIRGDLTSRTATVVMSNVECPSLSPDNREIAFKRRLPGTVTKWRLSVVDLVDLRVHSLAETRSVDDQVAWLDDGTVMYGVPEDAAENAALNSANPGPPAITTGASLATDTWVVPADGRGVPHRLNTGSWSTVVVRS
jgi:hypothetical protein